MNTDLSTGNYSGDTNTQHHTSWYKVQTDG